jgi:hypothetical protein
MGAILRTPVDAHGGLMTDTATLFAQFRAKHPGIRADYTH